MKALELLLGDNHWLPNAWLCAHASALAYRGPEIIKKCGKEEWGFDEVEFLSTDDLDTQLFIGRRGKLVLVSFRGTSSIMDGIVDADFNMVTSLGGHVHDGMFRALSSIWDQLMPVLRKWSASYSDLEIWLTGHSLGGGLAALAASRLIHSEKMPVAALFTFGQPAVGDPSFASTLTGGIAYYRCVNEGDCVPKTPPSSEKATWAHAGVFRCLGKSGLVELPDPGTSLKELFPTLIAFLQLVIFNIVNKFPLPKGVKRFFSDHMIHEYIHRVRRQLQASAPIPVMQALEPVRLN